MAASLYRNSYVQFLHFRPSPSPLQPNNYHFSAPEPRFLRDPLLAQMIPSSAVSATPRGRDRSPLAIHTVVSSREKAPKRKKMLASKQSRTTSIAADVANFRQMVQHMTGANFGDSAVISATLLGAEARGADCRGKSCKDVRTSCRELDGNWFIHMRMFPELQQAGSKEVRTASCCGGRRWCLGGCLTELRHFTRCSREENSIYD